LGKYASDCLGEADITSTLEKMGVRMPKQNRMVAQMIQYAMGTIMRHKAFGPNAEESLAVVNIEVSRLERLLSRFLPDSDIWRINASAGVNSEKVSHETFEVLSRAVQYSMNFPGCFDVTIEPLVNLWSNSKKSLIQPGDLSIKDLLPLVNYRDLILDPFEMTAGLRYFGQSIDLGGIGKGFAGDKILEVFKRFDITSAYSNLGGNVVTLGAKPNGTPWHVGIQHPRQEHKLIGSVAVVNQSVVTSGDYQRFFTDNQGKRCHHILDPNTGYPSDSGLISVSVVEENSMAADALSTILFVAGLQKGLEILKNTPQTEAILVDTDLKVYVTPGLRYKFEADQDIEYSILN
jgi:FAD:protein FMN transferase